MDNPTTVFPACDVCGSFDVYSGYQDLRELKPRMFNGVLWANFEAVPGSQHYFCKKHHKFDTGKIIRLEDQSQIGY